MKWSRGMSPEGCEQYRKQQRASIDEAHKILKNLSREELKKITPPLPDKWPGSEVPGPHWIGSYRVRAEVLLGYTAKDDGLELSESDLEELNRIAVEPKESDGDFLDLFDRFLADNDGENLDDDDQ